MLTFPEFKNILQLIASDDAECRILGQAFAKQYNFQAKSSVFDDLIKLDKHYIVYKDHIRLVFGNENISYEQAYEKYITSPHTRGIY